MFMTVVATWQSKVQDCTSWNLTCNIVQESEEGMERSRAKLGDSSMLL